jgi:serine/threonine protein phosphatase PrpC
VFIFEPTKTRITQNLQSYLYFTVSLRITLIQYAFFLFLRAISMMIKSIISKPMPDELKKCPDVSGQCLEYGFGYFETQGTRPAQEDALAWHLIDKSALNNLQPEDIGQRLWTTYHLIDQEAASMNGGTTASTTVFDGENLITATVGDAVTFGVAYKLDGSVIGVVRLNHHVHAVALPDEKTRIQKTNEISKGRVEGVLGMSRAIGDYGIIGTRGVVIDKAAIPADAHIDIINLNTIRQFLRLTPEQIVKFQIIATCDGFTEAAGRHQQSKQGHEGYLKSCLQDYNGDTAGTSSEKNIAEYLTKKAIQDGSKDNVSVAVQTLSGNAVVLGIYDGHNGSVVAEYIADNAGRVFLEQCSLTREHYAEQEFSVNKNDTSYLRDNPLKTSIHAVESLLAWMNDAPVRSLARRPRSVSIKAREQLTTEEVNKETPSPLSK